MTVMSCVKTLKRVDFHLDWPVGFGGMPFTLFPQMDSDLRYFWSVHAVMVHAVMSCRMVVKLNSGIVYGQLVSP